MSRVCAEGTTGALPPLTHSPPSHFSGEEAESSVAVSNFFRKVRATASVNVAIAALLHLAPHVLATTCNDTVPAAGTAVL